MKNVRRILPLLVVATVVVLGADSALAAGGGGAHEPHVANWWGFGSEHAESPALGWMFVTWAIFVAAIVGWVRKPLRNYLESRSNEVRRSLEEARQAKADAEARAAEYEERLRKLDAEVAALKDEFRAQGEAEHQRLEATARASAERIARDAQDTIDAETEKAREALKAEGARLALELAEERIRGAVGKPDHERLYKSFLQDLSA